MKMCLSVCCTQVMVLKGVQPINPCHCYVCLPKMELYMLFIKTGMLMLFSVSSVSFSSFIDWSGVFHLNVRQTIHSPKGQCHLCAFILHCLHLCLYCSYEEASPKFHYMVRETLEDTLLQYRRAFMCRWMCY